MYQLSRLILTLCWATLCLRRVWAEESCESENWPRVSLTSGCVEGLAETTVLGRDYFSFQGIPYAAAPIGDLRFKAPRPLPSWSGVLLATKEPPACLQPWRENPMPIYFSEDCLYLNVFTPYLKHPSGKPMPVIVWIHGGKHYQGSDSTYKYGPDFLFMKDVVLVNINYRLGIFGYLNLNVPGAQGNAAMKDKVAALRWVQREIHKFGGDPSRVTIAGGSSGASDVAFLYISPLARGLFHGAVSQSGSLPGPFASLPSPEPLALRVAASLGCPTYDPQDTAACLRDTQGTVLAEQQMLLKWVEGYEIPFVPSVETELGEEVFLPDTPQNLISKSGDIPYIIGFNSGEGIMYVNELKEYDMKNMKETIEKHLSLELIRNTSRNSMDEMTSRIEAFYFKPNPSVNDSIYGFIDFMTDKQFSISILKTVEALRTRAPVYLYYFTFEGEFQPKHFYNNSQKMSGVCHGDELGYIFYRNYTVTAHNNYSSYPRDMEMVKKAVDLWTNFATYGNPTPTEEKMNISWDTASSIANNYLVIGETLEMVHKSLIEDREALWDSLYQIKFQNVTHWRDKDVGLLTYTVLCLLAVFSLVFAVTYYIQFTRRKCWTIL